MVRFRMQPEEKPSISSLSLNRTQRTFLRYFTVIFVSLFLYSTLISFRNTKNEIHYHDYRMNGNLTKRSGTYKGHLISDIWASNLPEQEWFSDSECKNYVTRFAQDHTIDVVRLASFPRSGNTWTRYLLETATGIFTSSGGPNYFNYMKENPAYHRRSREQIWQHVNSMKAVELSHMGYFGETSLWTQGTTIVEKSHNLPQPWNQTEANTTKYNWSPFVEGSRRRAIVLVRDPFKSFISLRKYGETHSVLSGNRSFEDIFTGPDWEHFVIYYGEHWYDLNWKWVQRTNDTLVINYEALQKNPIQQLETMLDFLDVKPDPGRMRCLSHHLEGRVHNTKHEIVPDATIYPLHLRGSVWSHIHQLNDNLLEAGFSALPLTEFSFADEFAIIS